MPASVDYSQNKLNQASRYFPLIGWIIGVLCALIFWLSQLFLPLNVAIFFSMLFGIFLTGCFHEDGLADTCDGFGGGWNAQQKLAIMKDSRIGSYGATALWFALALKYTFLNNLVELSITYTTLIIIAVHPISRSVSTIMIFILHYVTDSKTTVDPIVKTTQLKNKI